MAEDSAIQWTKHTFNGWIGCERVSAGCKHCYAEVSTPARTLRAGGLEVWGPAATTARKKTSPGNWRLPERWNRAAELAGEHTFVFASSLCDVFEDHPAVSGWRAELFELIERTPHLVWQLLTKRPENLRRFLPATWLERPRANVWLGTTVEDQRAADERIPELLGTPAALRFLSCEPLLGRVNLASYLPHAFNREPHCPWCETCIPDTANTERWRATREDHHGPFVDWVIVGGESGPRARPFDLAWAYAIIEQCRSAGVACFVKQLGARPSGSPRARTPRSWLPSNALGRRDEWVLRDAHGGDVSEWPEDLRVREMPAAGGAR